MFRAENSNHPSIVRWWVFTRSLERAHERTLGWAWGHRHYSRLHIQHGGSQPRSGHGRAIAATVSQQSQNGRPDTDTENPSGSPTEPVSRNGPRIRTVASTSHLPSRSHTVAPRARNEPTFGTQAVLFPAFHPLQDKKACRHVGTDVE